MVCSYLDLASFEHQHQSGSQSPDTARLHFVFPVKLPQNSHGVNEINISWFSPEPQLLFPMIFCHFGSPSSDVNPNFKLISCDCELPGRFPRLPARVKPNSSTERERFARTARSTKKAAATETSHRADCYVEPSKIRRRPQVGAGRPGRRHRSGGQSDLSRIDR